MEKVVIVTDTYTNVNGVATSIKQLKKILESNDFEVKVLHPGDFKTTIPLPTYPEFKLAITTRKHMAELIKDEEPDYIHIATQGTLGLIARLACVKNKWKFTAQYPTLLPEYVYVRIKTLKKTTYRFLRWFHKPAEKTLVNTESLKILLEEHGFRNIVVAPVGIDVHLFVKNPHAKIDPNLMLKKPIFVFMGRLAPEKSIGDFLSCNLPGSQLIIGDGPSRKSLENEFGHKAVFVGYKSGQELVDLLSISDVFVFPSRTDTLGISMLEGMACGLPVAAFDVSSPKDVITNGLDGYLGDDLESNAIRCLRLNPENCRLKAMRFSEENWAKTFRANLVHI